MRIIDFDRVEDWEGWITEAIQSIAPSDLLERLRTGIFEYVEDASDVVLASVDQDKLVGAMREGLRGVQVRLYHGTRLSEAAMHSIEKHGLLPLNLASRRHELVYALRRHPDWEKASSRLDEAIERFGEGAGAGLREDGRIHVCFSRKGLLQGCSHYLTHGAEVDSHIVSYLFNRDRQALELLASYRHAYLVHFLKPFESTLHAADPYGLPTRELPSLIYLLIKSWSYRQAVPDFSSGSLEDCAAASFEGPIDRKDIEGIIAVGDCDLNWED